MRHLSKGIKAFILRFHAFINSLIAVRIIALGSCFPIVKSMNMLMAGVTGKVDKARLVLCSEGFSGISTADNWRSNRTFWLRATHAAVACTLSYDR